MSPARAQDSTKDLAARLALLRAALAQVPGAGALRLRGVGWLAWATGGIDAHALDADPGTAGLLVTPREACILLDAGTADALRAEPLPEGLSFHIAPWTEPELHDTYVLTAAGAGFVLSDQPRHDEQPLPATLRLRRLVLDADDQECLRQLGRDAAAAVGEALRAARPGWSECDLAGAAAQALWRRGAEPVRMLAAGSNRAPPASDAPPGRARLGRLATLRVSARRRGLHANLARAIVFGTLTDDERAVQDALLQVEATGLDAIRPGQSLAAVYHALDAGYRHANRPDAIRAGRQGGVTGYAVQELAATPSTALELEPGMAFALTPRFGNEAPGLIVGDTFLLGPDGLENLTHDPTWQAATVQGRSRPLPLEAT